MQFIECGVAEADEQRHEPAQENSLRSDTACCGAPDEQIEYKKHKHVGRFFENEVKQIIIRAGQTRLGAEEKDHTSPEQWREPGKNPLSQFSGGS